MSVFRINKTQNFTVMSNYHFKEKKMSLKAKGLLSLMLSLPPEWDYSVAGLTTLSKDGRDAVMAALKELEKFGYLTRERMKLENGQYGGIEYNIYEEPQTGKAVLENATLDNETLEKSMSEKPDQLNTYNINYLFNELYNVLNTEDEELVELYKDYIIMRKAIDSPLTETGLNRVIKKCKKLSYGNSNVEKLILENAVINNWKDIYLPRESQLNDLNQRFVGDFKELFGLE